ncbi:chorismate--pyruvate lyase family protein [Halorussus caseinilyticus]|uniref:Chorismate--pyruvate lyase family protein n=1 Tax=Halorussus caseinilyticus TaxID=3034025 RepID=A0ABD5WES5_9EURY|nr:chorismate pyruvate-lyase family protein [Halorussus sp. DT72]
MTSDIHTIRSKEQCTTIDDETFSTVERLILTHDGTVMRLLETLTGQSVDVDIVTRTVREDMLYRHVKLKPPGDSEPLAWAESEVDLASLDAEYADELREGNVGIGKLFREQRSETFRELVDVGLVTADDRRPSFVEPDAEVLFERTYDIYHDDTDIMTITEYFPKGEFEQFLP